MYFLKIIVLIFIAHKVLAQSEPRTQFQAGNTTTLVQFEKLMPARTYDFKSSDLQVKWHLLILDLIEQTPGYTPNVAARSLAYINLAGYESILPAYPNLKTLSGQIQGYARSPEYDLDSCSFIPQIALNAAIYKMVDEFFVAAPYVWMEKIVALKDTIDAQFSRNASTLAIMKSRNYGISIADLIIKYAQKDGASKSLYRSYDLAYRLPACESCFEINRVADLENTGPLHPYWGQNRTFMLANAAETEIKPQFTFSKYKDSGFYKEANEVYKVSKEVKSGTEKHNIANFWDDAATYSYTAVGHSVAILSQVLRNKITTIDSAAVYYVQLSMGLNDAMINTWRLKYKFNYLRPVAYIKKYIDSQWEPTILTPPFPEFPSGHSAQSACMSTILSNVFGDKQGFTDYSKFWVGAPRKFESFNVAAQETSISRLYGGIHFKDALVKGQELGKIVGNNMLKLSFWK